MTAEIDSLQIEIEATSSDAAAKVDALANALTNLKSAAKGGAGLTTVTRQLNALSKAAAQMNKAQVDLNNLRSLASALNSLTSVGKASGLTSTVNSLAKIPKITKELSARDLQKFGLQIQLVTKYLAPLAAQMDSIARGFSALPNRVQNVIQANARLSASNATTAKSFKLFNFAAYSYVLHRTVSFLADCVTSINEYVENVNLFQVSMGEFYDEAFAYAQLVNDKLGIDPSQWMRTQGVFMSIATGFGVARDQAYALSEGLTELAYDLSSLYNEDMESSALRLQSALAGEIEPIRRLGIAISEASLKEFALARGIDKSVESMTEQEKALLRTLKLMEGAANIGAIGDFARTLESPANALRVLNQQLTQFQRAIGSALLPLLVQLIPYVQAFVELLTDAISEFAVFLGFTMPEWDANDWASGVADATGEIEDATDAVNELKSATLGIDELNIISPSSSAAAGASGGGPSWADDLEIPDIWDKSALSEIQRKVDDLKEGMGPVLEIAIDIGLAILGWKVATGLFSAIARLDSSLSGLSSNSIFDKLGSAGLSLGLGAKFFQDIRGLIDSVQDIVDNGPNFSNAAGVVSGFAGAIGDALIVLGNTKVGGALLLVSGLADLVQGIADISTDGVDFGNVLDLVGGLSTIAIGLGALTKNTKFMGAGLVVGGIATVLSEISENWEAIKSGDWSGVDKVTLIIGALEALGGLAAVLSKIGSVANTASTGGAVADAAGGAVADAAGAAGGAGGGISSTLKTLAKNLGLGIVVIGEVAVAAALFVGAIAVLGYELQAVADAWSPVIEQGGTVLVSVGIGTGILAAVGVAAGLLGTAGTTLIVNIALGIAILAEVGAATALFVAEIWGIGVGLGLILDAWQPVLNDGGSVATAIGVGTGILVAVGVVAGLLGVATAGTAGLLPLAIALGTALLLELGAAALLFVAEIWAVGEALQQVKDAWQPVLDDGGTVEQGIAQGTALLVAIGVVTAALGVASVATVGLLPLAIAAGTAILVELASSFVAFTDSLTDVADELSDNLAPALRRLNLKLPTLKSDTRDFADYMTEFSGVIAGYTVSMGTVTWSSIVQGFLGLFAGNPIESMATDISNIGEDVSGLNEKVRLANPEITTAVTLMTSYTALMGQLQELIDASSQYNDLGTGLSTSLKEYGRAFMTGFSDGMLEEQETIRGTMETVGETVTSSLAASINENRGEARAALANIFSGVQIQLPHFSISGSFNLVSGSVPKINVNWYGSGGFPSQGEVFIAREAGAEMVGAIGRRTAVANNDQIVSGISAGVAEANDRQNELLREQNELLRAILAKDNSTYLDGKRLLGSVEKASRNKGVAIMAGGVV